MKLNVPFIFEALIVKNRCRKPTVVSVRDSITVDIKELRPEQLPVAMRVGEMELRWDGQKLWGVSYHNVYDQPAEIVSAKALRRNTHNGEDYRYSCSTSEAPFARFWRYEQDSMAKRHGVNMCCLLDRLDEADFINVNAVMHREWIDDNRQTMIDKARSIADSHIIIGDSVLSPIGEPMYVVNTFGLGNNHGGTAMFVTQSYNINIAHSNYFSALHYERACEYADSVARRRGDNQSVPVRPNDGHLIEVLIPDSVRADPGRQHGDGCAFINSVEAGINAGGPIGGLISATSLLANCPDN